MSSSINNSGLLNTIENSSDAISYLRRSVEDGHYGPENHIDAVVAKLLVTAMVRYGMISYPLTTGINWVLIAKRLRNLA